MTEVLFNRHVLPSDSLLHYPLPDRRDDTVNSLRQYKPFHIIRTRTNKFRPTSFHISLTVLHDTHSSYCSYLHFVLFYDSKCYCIYLYELL